MEFHTLFNWIRATGRLTGRIATRLLSSFILFPAQAALLLGKHPSLASQWAPNQVYNSERDNKVSRPYIHTVPTHLHKISKIVKLHGFFYTR